MKFFVDTADTAEIKTLVDTGLIDGVTTNPSLIAKSGRPFQDVIADICSLIQGPVSAEVLATDAETMIIEGRKLTQIAPNVVIKVPLTPDGLRCCKILSDEEIGVNVTLCFSPAQALLAAKAGARFISPFVGRLDDIGHSGMDLIESIIDIYTAQNFRTEVLVASVRSPQHVVDAARMGADVATLPPAIIHQLFKHPLTDKGLAAFLGDVAKSNQKVI